MKHDLLDLIDYHERKAKSLMCISNDWPHGQKDLYRFHIRSVELLTKFKEELYGK